MAKTKENAPDQIVLTQEMGTKMRIKLFDEKSLLFSDRLVEQFTEFMYGPKQIHKGPISLEVNLYNQIQVDGVIEYLKKLKGDIPIEEIGVKKSTKDKTIDKMLTDKEPLLDLLKTAKAKGTTQEKLINLLREYEFKFISGDVIEDMTTFDPKVGEQIKIRDKDIIEKYQFMVRLIKKAKEPMNDKYDFRLVFGIKYIGDRIDKVVIYLWGKFEEFIKIPWENKKANNFKKVEKVYIFPAFMENYADRKKWRTEHRKKLVAQEKNLPFEPSKFYEKWTPYIKGY